MKMTSASDARDDLIANIILAVAYVALATYAVLCYCQNRRAITPTTEREKRRNVMSTRFPLLVFVGSMFRFCYFIPNQVGQSCTTILPPLWVLRWFHRYGGFRRHRRIMKNTRGEQCCWRGLFWGGGLALLQAMVVKLFPLATSELSRRDLPLPFRPYGCLHVGGAGTKD